jgi:hypothetical protein
MRVTVLGPTRSGKTVYLAALLRAAFSVRRAARPIVVRADPGSEPAVALDEQANAVLTGTRLPATRDVATSEFFVDLPGSILFGIGSESMRLSMVDAPGGDCMPAPGSEINPQILQAVADADALLVVVPADAAARPDDYTERFSHVVRLARRQRQGTTAPLLRIAVVMTMAELLVIDREANALRDLESMDAADEITRACGKGFRAMIRGLVPGGADWYSLVSAFGFDIATGEVASEPATDGWRLRTNGMPFRDDWYPYRAFEPLEFLARGVCWRELS